MKKILKIICVLGILISCVNNKKPNPADSCFILKDSIFINIMVDVHLIEAAKHLKYIEHKNFFSEVPSYYNYIFAKHNITEIEFLNTYEHLIKDPLKMKKIMNKVIKKIEAKEAKIID